MRDNFEENEFEEEAERTRKPRGKTKQCKYCKERIREKAKWRMFEVHIALIGNNYNCSHSGWFLFWRKRRE